MRAPRAAARRVVTDFPETPPRPNSCGAQVEAMLEQADAMRAQAKAVDRLADIGELAIAAFQPAADAVAHLGDAQKKLCAFIVGNRLKIAVSIPLVLVAVGAVSPNVEHALSVALKIWGLG